jgi:hypothetical protein
LEEPAEIARIEPESRPQRPEVDAGGPDFENEPRLRQRPAPVQVIGFERADAAGDETVEAANLGELALVYSLTLVSNPKFANLARGQARRANRRPRYPKGAARRRSMDQHGFSLGQTTLEPAAMESIAATP